MRAVFDDVLKKEKCDEKIVKNLFLTCSDAGFWRDFPASLHGSTAEAAEEVRYAGFLAVFAASLHGSIAEAAEAVRDAGFWAVFAASLCGIDCVEPLYGIAVGSFGGSRETGFLYKKPASGDYLYKYPHQVWLHPEL